MAGKKFTGFMAEKGILFAAPMLFARLFRLFKWGMGSSFSRLILYQGQLLEAEYDQEHGENGKQGR